MGDPWRSAAQGGYHWTKHDRNFDIPGFAHSDNRRASLGEAKERHAHRARIRSKIWVIWIGRAIAYGRRGTRRAMRRADVAK